MSKVFGIKQKKKKPNNRIATKEKTSNLRFWKSGGGTKKEV